MYEYLDKTPDELLKIMLEEADINVDKRQGAVLYDALAPFSIVLAKLYYDLSISYDRFDYRTSYNEYLDLLAAQAPFGLTRFPAGKCKRYVRITGIVPSIGSRFFSDDNLYWTFDIDISDNSYYVICETAGEIGNKTEINSLLVPLNNYQDLQKCILSEIIIPGYEVETDESLRQRIYEKITKPALDGNKFQYEKWSKEYPGIGGVKVFPLWNGPNTVKVVIIDKLGEPASNKLVEEFQDYLDPGIQGLGEGVAPCGAFVTVIAATFIKIDISFTLIRKTDYSLIKVKQDIEYEIDQYFKKISFQENVVRISRIGALILETNETIDYGDLKINGVSNNIYLNNESVPIMGELTIIEKTRGYK